MNQLRLVFDPTDDLREASRACEAEVFYQWFGQSKAELDEEFSPYEAGTVFVALADDRGDVHGTVRLLAPGFCPPKTLDHLSRPPWSVDAGRSAAAARVDVASSWDVATLCVRAQYVRQPMAAMALYHALITVARVNDCSAFLAVLAQPVRALLDSVGIVTQPLPGARTLPFDGSPASTPVYAHIAPMLDRQRRELPDAYRLVTLGIGLDGIVVPEPEHFVLRRDRDRVPERVGGLVSAAAGSLG